MGSFNDKGRDRGPGRRRGSNDRKRQALPILESLEDRRLLTTNPTLSVWKPTTTDIADVKNGPLANTGPDLIKIYQDYQQYTAAGGRGNFGTSPMNSMSKYVKFLGDYVAVSAYGAGDFVTYIHQLQGIGMVVGGYDPTTRLVEGLLPINQLPTIAGLAQTDGVRPQAPEISYSQGSANNQSQQAELADVGASQYNVDGTGVTVGVLSTSVNEFQGGLADSVKTGDLPKNAAGLANVNVLFDNDATFLKTDEGRAMLEHIYDIAPGAGLAYHNGFSSTGGETVMAAGIRRLATEAGAKIIVDDIGFAFEPYYQDGPAAVAITDVTQNQGVTYFSAAGNSADKGFESPFRGVTTSVTGIGAGRFMNFNPNGTTTLLPITVNAPGRAVMQFDQPFGVPNGVTSDVDIYVLDSNNNVIASGTSNNIATNQPFEDLIIPTAGSYNMAIVVKAGSPDPGRVAVYSFTADVDFSHQFGNAGGINYPTTFGHPTADAAIGVGAVAWFDAPAFPGSAKSPTPSEDFSSFGPSVKVYNADGSRKPSPEFQQTPVLSGSDGGNTSFFGSPPGSLPTGLPANDYKLPNFFGTSDAAPDTAAVAALMKQLSPASNSTDIRNALIQSTIPLNGSPKGTWNVQGGYGLIQAPAALQAVDNLRVISTSPGNAQGLTEPPKYLVFNFSRDIDIRTMQASDLQFTAYSVPGLTIQVGQPLVDLTNLKQVFFPLTFVVQPGFKANGAYAYTLKAGSILATDGKPLVGYNGSFGVFDTIAPRVTNTVVAGRYVMATFSEPIDPATITRSSFYLLRTGASGTFGSPTNVVLNADPRLLVGYDSATNTAVLDFSAVDQSYLPTDHYALIVLDSVTDVVGNHLDGEFSGLFPSGNGQEGGNFTQDLGVRVLTAPQILTFGLDPSSDSGIKGDQNTNTARPLFSGQVQASFPAAAGGLTVVAQFNGVRGGTFDMGQGAGGRGFTGTVDVSTVTDATGHFSFRAPFDLPSGFQTVRLVVVGASEAPPLPGLSATLDRSFRIDINSPILTTDLNSVQQNQRLSSLSSIVIDAVDPVIPTDLGDPLAIPTQFNVPALDPATATNISNYSLINLGSDNALGGTGSAADSDFSSYITSAVFTATSQRTQTSDPFTGTISLNFAPGLPSGKYDLIAHRPIPGVLQGITDAAGNAIFSATPTGVSPTDFILTFDLQPTPAFITSVQAVTSDPLGGPDTLSGPKSYFELPVPGNTPRATAPPSKFYIDFSNPLDTTKNYTDFVQLIRSANSAISQPDGDFGVDPTFQNGVGYTRVADTTVTLVNSVLGATFGTPGYKNRLVLSLAPGTSLPADHYRLFIPNMVRASGADLRIVDQFGNLLDGEFLGNPSPTGDGTYENLLSTGQIRPNDLSGDGVPGGSFETGYSVVPNGNIIYARPDYLDDPFLPTDDPDGSVAHPYPVLAPEAAPNAVNGGDLNSVANFTTGFDPRFDLNGNGHFDRSAFVAAAAASSRGPVVIVALPAATDPTKTYVIQAASGIDPTTRKARDGSATVPFDTTLAFAPGSIVKFFNASLFVQNQGSSIQVRGGPNPSQQVYFTSYRDDTVGGDSNRDGIVTPGTPQGANGGDWGGIVLRNFDDTSNGGRAIPVAQGPTDYLRPRLGVSGADETLSFLDQATIRYAGGAVPQTNGFRFDAITNFNTRPALTNLTISQTGGGNSAQAAISGDVDSFREDNLARGILVRRANVFNNSINGIYVRAEVTGVAMPTDAITHPDNPANLGGTQNYSFFAPLPYVLVSRLVIGQTLLQDQNGRTQFTGDRFYFQPGTVVKFQRGAAIDEVMPPVNVTPARVPSLNIGDRTYLNEYDVNNSLAPTDPGFKPANFGDAQVVFTSFFDDNATSAFRDPNTGALTPIVAPIDSDNGGNVNLPVEGNVPPLARWGGISVRTGAIFVMDEATLEFGGGSVNTAGSTIPQRDVLAFEGAGTNGFAIVPVFYGTTAYVTNNNFFDNLQAPISTDVNGLLATDPLRPLQSGNPFFRGNVMLRNQLNGLEVMTEIADNGGGTLWGGYDPNLFVDSVWDDTDLTYILRRTIRLAGTENARYPSVGLPAQPDISSPFLAELKPSVVLTIQSSLPDGLLANGQKIARPGESAIVKLLNGSAPLLGDGVNGMPANNFAANDAGGAGFMAGEDNGVDPPGDPLVDGGYLSQIRILGIGGNQTTGQQRVPVVITSVRDDTVGRTVRGVDQFQASFGNTTAPAAGDGGVILVGALGLSDYNLLDPRDGSLIDNADLKYMTRVEQQGGGWVYLSRDGAYQDRPGTTPDTQYNTAKAMTVSNSNFSNFSQAGFIAHPSGAPQLTVSASGQAVARAVITAGQPTLSFFVNNTFSNMPVGVRINSENIAADVPAESPPEGIFLNNTFNNTDEGIHAQGAVATGINPMAHVHFIAMDNVFSNNKTAGINALNQVYGSQAQYNLFGSNAADVIGIPNFQPVSGNPQYRNAAKGDFTLMPNSDAIDSSRSEIGPLLLGNSLQPIVTQVLDSTGGIRRATGRTNPRGGLGGRVNPGDIISLPGSPLRDFYDEWDAALPGSPGAVAGPAANAGGAFSYTPAGGLGIEAQRDQSGQLRVDDPNRANVGFGARPFFDIGAFEYVQLNPPHITGVTAVINNPSFNPGLPVSTTNPTTVTVPFYTVGGLAGANQTPHQIVIQLDQRLDASTVNNKTITLTAAGGDGIFDNGNDKTIDLSGKLVYDATNQVILINLADSGLALANDVYRLEVFGSGGDVIRNPQGLALDGENTVGDQPNAPTLPLPTGDQFPGGNFFLPFAIDTHPPAIVPGTLALAAASDTGARDNITSSNTPSFTGSITDIAPPANAILGQTAIIDVSTLGNGVFDRLGVASGITDARGVFTANFVAGQPPLPDTAYNVGPDGILGTADDSGYSVARVRIIDQSGNVSNLNDPNGLVRFVVDTKGPRVVNSDPLPGNQAPSSASGVIPVAIAVNENIAPSTFTVNSIKVVRAGGDGIFGNANDVTLGVDPASLVIQNLNSPSGAEILRFNVIGATASDIYRVSLLSTGTSAITDVAGNALDGEGNGFPSGDGIPGGDFNLNFIVFNPSSSRLLFVGKTVTSPSAAQGSRDNPYPSITAGMTAAQPGDTVAVLPGVYTETVALRSLVRLISAGNASTDTSLTQGNALQTIIRAPQAAGTAPTTTVQGDNLFSIAGFSTEVSGFTIASPLVGNSATGPINEGSFAVLLNNSDVLFDKNYIVDSGVGIGVNYGGANAAVPRFESDVFAGNIIGLLTNDVSTTSFKNNRNIEIANNDFVYNTFGYQQLTNGGASGLNLASLANNIFWQNADNSGSRVGIAIAANQPNRMSLNNNIFSGNGPSDTSPADDTLNVGNGFNPAILSSTPDAGGNITGNPAFVSPIDPRPDGSGPGNFFLGANFDLQASSAAIDLALNALAPSLDFLYRSRVDIAAKGRPGAGPADIGAFEFKGSATTGVGSTGGGGISTRFASTPSDIGSFAADSVAPPVTNTPTTPTTPAAPTSAAPATGSTGSGGAGSVRTAVTVSPTPATAIPVAPPQNQKKTKKAVHHKAVAHKPTKPSGPASFARRFMKKSH